MPHRPSSACGAAPGCASEVARSASFLKFAPPSSARQSVSFLYQTRLVEDQIEKRLDGEDRVRIDRKAGQRCPRECLNGLEAALRLPIAALRLLTQRLQAGDRFVGDELCRCRCRCRCEGDLVPPLLSDSLQLPQPAWQQQGRQRQRRTHPGGREPSQANMPCSRRMRVRSA